MTSLFDRNTHKGGPTRTELRKRNQQLKKRYGITLTDFSVLLMKQHGVCAICGVGRQRLTVDHCHNTGKVRGLLCGKCNIVLGMAGDSEKVLTAAIQYLKKQE